MSLKEEELQKKIEAGQLPAGDEADIRAYQEIFQALKREPQYTLSANFADRIVGQVMAKRKHDASRDFFWLCAGIFFIVVAFVVAIIMTGFKLNFGFLNAISKYTGVFIFGGAFILVLNLLDKRLISRRMNKLL